MCKVFFPEECDEDVVLGYLRDSKPTLESARAGLGVLWPFGAAEAVLSGLSGIGESGTKKVLCMAGEKDVLITPEMVRLMAEDYRTAVNDGEETVMEIVLQRSGHHLMLDIVGEESASMTLAWLEN